LKETYDDVLIIHNNNLFCSRSALWWEFYGSYLQYNTKTDFLRMTKSVIIRLIPFIFLRKYEQLFIDQFGTFDYKHANSILVTTFRCI
jgi:hypothetical protein